MSSHGVEELVVRAVPLNRSAWCGAAPGRRSSLRSALRGGVASIRWTVPAGSCTAGVPGAGVFPPVAAGRSSQYWLSALTLDGPEHAPPGDAASAPSGRTSPANATRPMTRTRRTMEWQ